MSEFWYIRKRKNKKRQLQNLERKENAPFAQIEQNLKETNQIDE